MSAGKVLLLAGGPLIGAAAVWTSLPMHPWTAALGLATTIIGFAGLVIIGVLIPQLAMFAPIVCRATTGRPEVALTFDDGPSPSSTPKVLAELARYRVHATFFVLGDKVEKHPDLVHAIHEAGHEIGLHGLTHDRLLSLRHPRRITSDLERAQTLIESVTGQRTRLFRPPVGHVSPRTAVAARRLRLTLVGWSVRSRDGLRGSTAADVAERVLSRLTAGAIVLLHDASERETFEPAGVGALPAILAEARRRGLGCVTVSQALAEKRSP